MIKGLRFLATTFLIGSSYASLITSNEFGEMLKGDSREAIRTLYNAPMSNEEQANGISLTDAGKYFREFEDFVGKVIREADEQKDDNLIDMLSVLGCYKFDGTAYKTIIDIALYNRYVDKLVKTPEFKQMVEKAREKRIAENNISRLAGKVNAKNAKEGLKHEIKEFADYKNKEKEAQQRELATMASEEELSKNVELENAIRKKIEEGIEKFNKDHPKTNKQSNEPTAGKERKSSFDLKPEGPTKEEVAKWKSEKPKKVEEPKKEQKHVVTEDETSGLEPLFEETNPPATVANVPQVAEQPLEIKPVVPTGENVPLVVEHKKEEPKKEEIKKPAVINPLGFGANINKILHKSMIFGDSSEKPKNNSSDFVEESPIKEKENELLKKLSSLRINEFENKVKALEENEFKIFISSSFYNSVMKKINDEKLKQSVADDANKRLCELINKTPEVQVEALLKDVHPDIMNEFNKKEGGILAFGWGAKERLETLIVSPEKREIVKKFIDEKLNKTSKKLKKSKSEIFHPSEENKKSSDTFWTAS